MALLECYLPSFCPMYAVWDNTMWPQQHMHQGFWVHRFSTEPPKPDPAGAFSHDDSHQHATQVLLLMEKGFVGALAQLQWLEVWTVKVYISRHL